MLLHCMTGYHQTDKNNTLVTLDIEDVYYVEALKSYVQVITDSQQKLYSTVRLFEMKMLLENHHFHMLGTRYALINLKQIKAFDKNRNLVFFEKINGEYSLPLPVGGAAYSFLNKYYEFEEIEINKTTLKLPTLRRLVID
jgi:DNA-binding LytR/AlgR family response regulator